MYCLQTDGQTDGCASIMGLRAISFDIVFCLDKGCFSKKPYKNEHQKMWKHDFPHTKSMGTLKSN